jgi:Fur family transcriptional regulator, ferric uptake regulator
MTRDRSRDPAPVRNSGARWTEYLVARKLRATRPRRQILEAVARAEGPFGAEAIRLRLRGEGKPLSRATVYRTLGHLTGAGILRRVQLADDSLQYELSRPDDPRHHLVCRRCGSVQEIQDPGLGRGLRAMFRRASFDPEAFSLRVRGLCARCAPRHRSRPGPRSIK